MRGITSLVDRDAKPVLAFLPNPHPDLFTWKSQDHFFLDGPDEGGSTQASTLLQAALVSALDAAGRETGPNSTEFSRRVAP